MIDYTKILQTEQDLDPQDWNAMKKLAVRMVEDMFDHLEHVGERAVWKKTPKKVIKQLDDSLPLDPMDVETIYKQFQEIILPYNKGNLHPRFWGWVIGTGSPFGMMAEMLSAGMNADICMGGHSPMYVEEQVIDWLKTIMKFPQEASGILVSGTSMANLTGLVVARDHATNQHVHHMGMQSLPKKLVMYVSKETHSCVTKAADIIGLGMNSVRIIGVDKTFGMDVKELQKQIDNDIRNGYQPFCVVASVGTVNTGAIDPLRAISAICKKDKLWLHIDGAYGAFGSLVPDFNEELNHLNLADSLAFDMHKWMSMPMGVGCLLVKDRTAHRRAFSIMPDYLGMQERGIVSGPDPTFNYGIEMTKEFRSLKVWMLLKENGINKYAKVIKQNIAQAAYLEHLIIESELLELMTAVTLNVICFRYNPGNIELEILNKINKVILMDLQESGEAAVSHTILENCYVMRAAIVNHRSRKEDFDALVRKIQTLGKIVQSTISL